MDIKSWILLVGTLLIVAVICHGFWTAYRVRKNDVRMEIETDLPDEDVDDIVLWGEELPNGGARVTPTEGYDALRVRKRKPADGHQPDTFDQDKLDSDTSAISEAEALEEALMALDDAVAYAGDGLAPELEVLEGIDEGDLDAGYQPEQATLDLEMEALEERFAARAADLDVEGTPMLTDAQSPEVLSETAPEAVPAVVPTSELPPKKQITPERAAIVPRKQFEPPSQEELEAQRTAEREKARKEQQAKERAEIAAAAERQRQKELEREKQERYDAKVEAQRLRRLEQQQREAQARLDAENREKAKAEAKALREAQREERRLASQDQPEQLSLTPEPVVEFPETSGGFDSGTTRTPPAEELVVLNVVAKTRPFQGVDVLELFYRNGIKFGDMNIFHRMDPVSRASEYSIASVTEPGYFDLQAMPEQEFRGLCLFMQLPCPSQATKVFTDMHTVADKLARQLEGEVCDEQFNRLTRQSKEHYRQRVAEFTRRTMSRRA